MSKLQDQVIINSFKRIFYKYKRQGLGPLKIAELIRIAYEREMNRQRRVKAIMDYSKSWV